jgi:hypothetical protein
MAKVYELRGAHVVGFDVLPDLEFHFVGVLVFPRRLRDGEYRRQDATIATGD